MGEETARHFRVGNPKEHWPRHRPRFRSRDASNRESSMCWSNRHCALMWAELRKSCFGWRCGQGRERLRSTLGTDRGPLRRGEPSRLQPDLLGHCPMKGGCFGAGAQFRDHKLIGRASTLRVATRPRQRNGVTFAGERCPPGQEGRQVTRITLVLYDSIILHSQPLQANGLEIRDERVRRSSLR